MQELNWLERLKAFAKILQAAYTKWSKDKAARIASSLAFYIGLSLAPLLVFAVAVVGFVLSGAEAQALVIAQVDSAMGQSGVDIVESALNSASDPGEGVLASILSLSVLIFSASNLFLQMQDGFNTIWHVPPEKTKGILNLIIGRLRAFAAVIFVGILLLGMVVLNSIVSNIEALIGTYTPFLSFGLPVLNAVASLLILTLIFTIMFRRMPKTKIRSKDVVLGAFVAAILFQLGNFGLAYYLANASIGSAYGAAGSLLVVLVWFFYTMQIILLGAEVSYVYAHEYGSRKVFIDNPGPEGERVLDSVSMQPEDEPEPANPVRGFFSNLRARFSKS